MDITPLKTVKKPWGEEVIWAEVKGKYLGKALYINAGESLSLQYHILKDETMVLQYGTATLTLDGVDIEMVAGLRYHITPGTEHRLSAGSMAATVLEVSTYHPDDVVRLEDKYGRSGS